MSDESFQRGDVVWHPAPFKKPPKERPYLIEATRGTTDEVVKAITSPEVTASWPHCGLALPESGPPMCPRCGAPY